MSPISGRPLVELGYQTFPNTTITIPAGTAASPVAFTGTGTPFNMVGIEVPDLQTVLIARILLGNVLSNAAAGSVNCGIGDITTVATPGTVLCIITETNGDATASAWSMFAEARVQANALVGSAATNPIRTFQPVGGSVTSTNTFTPTANVISWMQVLAY